MAQIGFVDRIVELVFGQEAPLAEEGRGNLIATKQTEALFAPRFNPFCIEVQDWKKDCKYCEVEDSDRD